MEPRGTPERSRAGLAIQRQPMRQPSSQQDGTPGHLHAPLRVHSGAAQASRNLTVLPSGILPLATNRNHESDHMPKGTRGAHQCLASFFFSPEITKTCLYKC